eukprot:TRINITY_DN15702_c0_g1_i3.p1 TRINITY_DN15702_c0_g1~~TRINITY_DN15702_c0_g1_i3.p1  ORF type:complete len:357 (-),score=39.63 TRINITY_DN15702_c0_g1_i3:298-1215(-)
MILDTMIVQVSCRAEMLQVCRQTQTCHWSHKHRLRVLFSLPTTRCRVLWTAWQQRVLQEVGTAGATWSSITVIVCIVSRAHLVQNFDRLRTVVEDIVVMAEVEPALVDLCEHAQIELDRSEALLRGDSVKIPTRRRRCRSCREELALHVCMSKTLCYSCLILRRPSLAKFDAECDNLRGDESGVPHMEPKNIELVMSQLACSRAEAVEALKANNNDIVDVLFPFAAERCRHERQSLASEGEYAADDEADDSGVEPLEIDIKVVMSNAQCSRNKARNALITCNNDIVEAIVLRSKRRFEPAGSRPG